MACARVERIGSIPNYDVSRGYVSDSGLHPSPRCTRSSPFEAFASRLCSTERLTRPYSGGLVPPKRGALSTGNHCQVTPPTRLHQILHSLLLSWLNPGATEDIVKSYLWLGTGGYTLGTPYCLTGTDVFLYSRLGNRQRDQPQYDTRVVKILPAHHRLPGVQSLHAL